MIDRLMQGLGVAVLLAGAGLAAALVARPEPVPAAVPVSAAPSAVPAPQGGAEDVYLDKCAVCHAKDGSGNTAKGRKVKAKDLRSAEIQKMTDAQLIDAVAHGKGKDMDGFEKELGADTVKKLVAYCRTLAKP